MTRPVNASAGEKRVSMSSMTSARAGRRTVDEEHVSRGASAKPLRERAPDGSRGPGDQDTPPVETEGKASVGHPASVLELEDAAQVLAAQQVLVPPCFTSASWYLAVISSSSLSWAVPVEPG